MNEPVYQRAKQLLEAELGPELMALDVDAGSCFGFNSVAADIWRKLEEPKRFGELKAALMDEYEVDEQQCSADLAEILEQLENAGLVRKNGVADRQR